MRNHLNASWRQLDRGAGYRRTRPCFLRDAANGPADNRYLAEIFANESCAARPIVAFWLPDAFVFGQGTVVTAEGSLVKDSAAEFINHGLAPDGSSHGDGILRTIAPAEDAPIAGTALLVKRPWFRNFGHWLVDLMPLLALASRERLRVDTLVFGDVPAGPLRHIMEHAARHLFPDAERVFVGDDRVLRFETLLYIEPVHVPPLYKNPVAVASMIEACRELFPHPVPDGARRLYVSRQNTAARRILNDAELGAVLAARGFATVHPEGLGFGEQIALLSRAEMVVGVKGAALTTAAFCAPGTDLLVLSPSGFIDPFFWDLVTPRGVRYGEVFCEAGDGQSTSMRDLRVDLAAVTSYLDQVGA